MNLGEFTATVEPSGNSWFTVNSVLSAAFTLSAAVSYETKHNCSLIVLTICYQADLPVVPSEIPSALRRFTRWSVIALPAIKFFLTACGIEKPSYTGTVCVTPSPESTTRPVVLPFE